MRPSLFLMLVVPIPGMARPQWTKSESGTTRNLNSVGLPMGVPIVVGDSGTILTTSNGGGNGFNAQPNRGALLQIHPNPASTGVTIESAEPAIEGLLTISNISGMLILTCKVTGHKTRIDISILPGGVYFVRLTGDKTVQVGKFVKRWQGF